MTQTVELSGAIPDRDLSILYSVIAGGGFAGLDEETLESIKLTKTTVTGSDNVPPEVLNHIASKFGPEGAPIQVGRRQALTAIMAVQEGKIPELTNPDGSSMFPTLANDVLYWRNNSANLAEIAEYDNSTWRRDSQLLLSLSSTFGLNQSQIDDVLRYAAKV